ncbi:MAG: choice-of-anchor A family protein [Pseudomonadota bacterium]
MRKLPAAFAAVAALVVAAPAAAESAADFQLYVLGDLKLDGNGVNHRTAVGGDAKFTSSSLGGATAANPYSLVVGGDLTYKNGGSINGGALVGGTNGAPVYMPVTAGASTLPVDFDVENLRLKNLSDTLGAMAATGTAENKWGGLFLTGLNSDLNVFTISSAMLSQASWFSVNIASGSQVLINVTGDNVKLTGGLSFGNASNILWNFVDANNIKASNVSIGGSVLAPDAMFHGGGGTISGNLIAGGFNGAMSFGDAGYAGSFLTPPPPRPTVPTPGTAFAVPEPGVWALMILGFGAVGAQLRRRRTALAAA